jgi:hypothetical protein
LKNDGRIVCIKRKSSDNEPILYSPLFRFLNISGEGLSEAKKLVDEHHYHPLAGDKTTAFLKFLVQRFWRNGQFRTDAPIGSVSDQPVIYRRPVLFVGPRNQGYAEMLDSLVLALPGMDVVPESLARIVGVDLNADDSKKERQADDPTTQATREKIDILFTNPSTSFMA